MNHELRYRSSIPPIFSSVGVNISPTSCLLVPLVRFSGIKQTTIKTRTGNIYDATVFILPTERLSSSIQEAPYGEESFCNPPCERSILLSSGNTRVYEDQIESKYPLYWEQLRFIKEKLNHLKRPRKMTFNNIIDKYIIWNKTHTEHIYDTARRQYLAYVNGPLDEIELLSLHDSGLPTGIKCSIDDISKFLPDDILKDPLSCRRALNQWISVTETRRSN